MFFSKKEKEESGIPYQQILDNSPIGTCWLDSDEKLLFASAAAVSLLGGALEEGTSLQQYMVEDDYDRFAEWLRDSTVESCRCCLSEGNRSVTIFRQQPVTGLDGVCLSLVPVNDSMQSDFASAIAHDFNNVLASVAVFSQLLEGTDLSACDGADEYVEPLLVACRLGQNFTANLQVYSGRRQPRLADVSMAAVMQSIRPVLCSLLSQDIDIICEVLEDKRTVRAEQFMVEQILINLALNARDAMPEGGEFRLSNWEETVVDEKKGRPDDVPPDQYMVFSVSDTGVGIAESLFERIFLSSYTAKQSKHNVGLGLAVVAAIMRMHHGFVQVNSELDVGTTFVCYLPLGGR